MKTLNEREQLVLGNANAIAEVEGNEKLFNFDDLLDFDLDNNEKQLKGYLSQLIQKGYVEKLEDCYYDFKIVEK